MKTWLASPMDVARDIIRGLQTVLSLPRCVDHRIMRI